MIRHWLRLLRWEWRLAFAERSYRATLAVLAFVAGAAFVAGHSWTLDRKAVLDAALAQESEDEKFLISGFTGEEDYDRIAGRKLTGFEKGRARNFHLVAKLPSSLAYYGSVSDALMPPSPLASLAVGHSDLQPDRLKITAWSKRTILDREDIVNPSFLATAPFDPSTLAVALMPLVLILLGHDLISGDRERGVLALTLSQPTSHARILVCRLLSRILAPTALVAVATTLGLATGGVDPTDPPTAGRLALWSGLVLAYGAFWGALALAVNVLGGSSIANAIALVACWVLTVLVVPAAITKAAAEASPIPPRSDLVTRERAIAAEAEADGGGLLDRYFIERPWLERPGKDKDPYGQNRWVAIAEEVDRRMRPELERRRSLVEGQLAFASRWAPASPALAVKAAMDDLAGTSLRHHLEFTAAAEDFHTRYMDHMRPLMMTRGEIDRDEFERIPRYDIYNIAGRVHAAAVRGGYLVPAAWAGVLLLISTLALRRPVRAS